MITSRDPNAHLVALARRLTEQTRAKRIQWTRQGDGRRYLYAGTSGSVTVEKEPGSYPKIVMRVRDMSGVPVDEVQTADIPMAALTDEAHRALMDLYDAVSESARGVVNDLLAELG